jgi:F-type H+-transporting ATPase subunit delta
MNQSKISVRYAKAFYEFGSEKNILPSLVDDAKLLSQSFQEIKELRDFITNPIVKPSDKKYLFLLYYQKKYHNIQLILLQW